MENELVTRRTLIILLVIVTIVIFVGLVWLIATFGPWNLLGIQNPTTTANQVEDRDCTYPISYWRVHPELYPTQIIIGGMIYREFELRALLVDDTPDTIQQIKAQMAVAFLNGSAGADQSSIQATLFEAYGWLEKHSTGNQVSSGELEQGRLYYDLLEAYNLGLTGVAACEPALSVTKTQTPTGVGSVEASLTPSQTNTPTASSTLTLTVTSTMVIGKTNTPIPTTSRPIIPNATSTKEPTATPRPTDTPENTLPPPPTPTFTLPPPPITPTLPPPP